MPKSIEQLDPNFAAPESADGLTWYDVRSLGIEGQGWRDVEQPFDRLPARAKGVVTPEAWEFGRHTAGLCARFVTDSGRIAARWTLNCHRLVLTHMPASAASGVDLYVREARGWRYAGTAKSITPERGMLDPVAVALREKEFTLYFPLYNGVDSMQIGIDPGANFRPAPPRRGPAKPVVFYGTSIVQGASASRPGMAYPAILGRWLDCPTLNLGFSGNGPMHLEMATFLAELDPLLFVIDSLPNMDPQTVAERAEPFMKTICAKHPATPIVLVENIIYQTSLADSPTTRHGPKNEQLRAAFDRLAASGVPNLHYLPADGLLGDDWEATVDGTHLTDLGFHRFATAMLPLLKDLV